jgi:tetratricopeptide (TPR) repeat protein
MSDMNRGSITRALSACLFAALVTAGPGQERTAAAQAAQPASSPTVADLRQMVADARKDIDGYATAGGAADAADHPAIKWSAAMWEIHDRAPKGDAGTLAAVEAIRLLNRSALWDRAHARVESLDADDPAWQRLPTALYEEGITRKSFEYTIATLSRTIAATTAASNKAAALLVIGRVHRRQGDLPGAMRSIEEARAAAPGTPQAEEADGLIYEITYLSVGLPAPAISGKPRNARRAITLDSFRGKPIVLVFWAST